MYQNNIVLSHQITVNWWISSTPGVPSMRFMALMLDIGMLLWNVHVQQRLGHMLGNERNMKHPARPFILRWSMCIFYWLKEFIDEDHKHVVGLQSMQEHNVFAWQERRRRGGIDKRPVPSWNFRGAGNGEFSVLTKCQRYMDLGGIIGILRGPTPKRYLVLVVEILRNTIYINAFHIYRFHPPNIQHLRFIGQFYHRALVWTLLKQGLKVWLTGGGPLKPLPNGGHV